MGPHTTARSLPPRGLPALLVLVAGLTASCRDSSSSTFVGTTGPVGGPVLNVDFGLRRDLSTGTAIGDVIHLNVDQDVDDTEDLVETHFFDMSVVIEKGQTDGTFVKDRPLSTIGHAWRVAAGDFNGDGLPDLAVLTWRFPDDLSGAGTGAVQVFTQGPAAGEFSTLPATYLVGANPLDLAVAPGSGVAGSTGPGNPDELFVAVDRDREVVRLSLVPTPGGGASLQRTGALSSSNLAVTGAPLSIVTLDFDRDGGLDVLVGERAGPEDRLVRYPRPPGGSDFGAAESFLEPLFGPELSHAGDVDGDGFEDLAVAQTLADLVYLVRFDVNADPLTTAIDLGARSTSLIFHDLDDDGFVEAIGTTLKQSSVQVLPGTGVLAWGEAVHYSVGPVPRAIDVVFLPGDDVPDLLCGNAYDLSLLLGVPGPTGAPTGSFRAARGFFTTPPDPIAFPDALNANAVMLADLDNDRDLDAVAVSRKQFAISFLEGAGDGTFEVKTALPLHPTDDDKPGHLAVADMDGDQRLDVLTTVEALGELRLYRGTASVETIAAPPPQDITQVGAGPLGLDIADMNGDTVPDVVVANAEDETIQMAFNGAGGNLTAMRPMRVDYHPGGILTADFDENGDVDVAVVGWDANDDWLVVVYAGDGMGGLDEVERHPLDGPSRAISRADFDSNGKLDFAVGQTRSAQDELFVFMNDGNLAFTSQLVQARPGPVQPLPADLNNDGDLDLGVVTDQGEFLVVLGDGQGGFTDIVPEEAGELPVVHLAVGAALGDVNGNGLLDLVTVSVRTPFLWVGKNTSTPVKTTP